MRTTSEFIIAMAFIVLVAAVMILSVEIIDQEYRIKQLEYLVKNK